MSWPISWAVLPALALTCLFGCSSQPPGPPRLATVPAGGRVTMGGAGVNNSLVEFHLDGHGPLTRAETADDGTFRLTTYTPNDGAPVGKYKVTIHPALVDREMKTVLPDNPDGSPPTYPMKKSRAAVPQQYSDVNTTKLAVEVTEAGPNEFTLDVKK